ncbi:protein 5NUC-like [Sitodiplosis mosellana]|uniref:protein 5NUC-like n=1 Tax=Sitodiplosis mosellana TaxID=263140 RepID=UPI0024452EBF|nr:protein 5NUC-like [Sitodiplosis mosellana]
MKAEIPFLLSTIGLLVLIVAAKKRNLELQILHNNDMHSRFEQTNQTGRNCSTSNAEENQCYGGMARVSYVIKEYRNKAKNGGPPVLYLNAGDTYNGTFWWALFRDQICADYLNILKPDVMCLGNHEFDLGTAGLVAHLRKLKFPVVMANLNNSKDHPLEKIGGLMKSIVLNVTGFEIGVIGYLRNQTKNRVYLPDVDFSYEVDAINQEAKKLTKNGVKIIIALGHSGFTVDKIVAKNCPLVDLVVGGHTNAFLWNGPQPDFEVIEGPYPTVITQDSGKQVPVVQAYKWTKYLGVLNVTFNKNGELINWSGQPLLLNGRYPQDPEILALNKLYTKRAQSLLTGSPPYPALYDEI